MSTTPAKCGNIPEKCLYQKILLELRTDQNNGLAGTLGPVKSFIGLKFFDQFNSLSPSIRDVLEGSAYLSGYAKYYVCGDFHGDLMVALSVLRLSGLIDEDANWIPAPPGTSRRCFVQLGDMVDRGGRGKSSVDTSYMPREELNLIEYMYELDIQARKNDERVLSVSGNHELYAVRAAFDKKLDVNWNFATKPTQCPFPTEGISRNELFRLPGALKYFAFIRPPLALSSLNWLFCHGDMPVKSLRKFLRTHRSIIRRLRNNTLLPFAACVVGATNMLWASHILLLGGDDSFAKLVAPALIGVETLSADALSAFPFAVCTCRTLARKKCNCDTDVDPIARVLGLDWTVSGGVALGHTVQANLASKCAGKVQLLDIGMSEAFRGYNTDHHIGVLEISTVQELNPIQK
jgi:hypothetical protein